MLAGGAVCQPPSGRWPPSPVGGRPKFRTTEPLVLVLGGEFGFDVDADVFEGVGQAGERGGAG